MRTLGVAGLGLAAALGGCVVGPDYRAPAAPVPAAFSRQSETADLAAWWRGFGDPELSSLVERAMAGNLDVRQAGARIEQARLQGRIAGAAGRPMLAGDARGGYAKLGQSSASGAAQDAIDHLSDPSGIGPTLAKLLKLPPPDPSVLRDPAVGFYQAGFDASWELDLFGGVKRSREAAKARATAAGWSLRDAQVMLAAEVARAYLQHREIERRIATLDEMLKLRADALDYDKVRQHVGLVTTLDERAGERDIALLTAERQDLAAQRDAQAHALALLLGHAPLSLSGELAAAHGEPAPPEAVPVGLPSDLLRRRPDIRAAERELAAATADIGVATADLYPKISLTSLVGPARASLGDLLTASGFLANIDAVVKLPLLDGGRGRATVKLRRAQAKEAALAYQSAVLAALRDVEDALTRLQADRDREAQLQAVAATDRDALETARTRRHTGLGNALDVIAAQAALLDADDALAQAKAAAGLDVVALYKALGGGWEETGA